MITSNPKAPSVKIVFPTKKKPVIKKPLRKLLK